MSPRLPLLAALLVTAALSAADEVAFVPGTQPSYAKEVRPLLETYCIDCHGGESTKGEIDLARLKDESEAQRELRTWRAVSIKVGGHEMPPLKKKQPTDGERATIMRWIVGVRARQPRDPGRVTLHRLNRNEYDNTVRDLCGIDLDPAKDFPADDVGQGFDNIADVLSLPPLLLEKYLAAADAVLAKAIVDQRVEYRFEAEKMEAVKAGQPLAAAADAHDRTWDDVGEAWQIVKLPADGKHTLKVRAWAVNGGAEPATLMLKVDERPVKAFKVTSGEKSAATFTATVDLQAGDRRIAVAFINPISGDAPAADPKPAPQKPGQRQRPGQPKPMPMPPPAKPAATPDKPAVRTLSVDWIEVQGPSSAAPPESHKRIMIAKPSDKLPKRDAAKQIVERFASRAWRRPVADAEVERLLGLFDKADAANETFEDAIRLTLKAVLASPRFLFRIERDKPGERGIAALDDWELASRLSYFLWSSMPDDQLFELARAGKLSDPEILVKQVRRMFFDPKSRALVDGFASEWLPLRKIETIAPDPKLYPDFDKPLRKAMIDEATSFFAGIMHEDRSVLEFVDCDYVWVNDRLAKHYGIAGVSGKEMRKVPITDHARGGVLGMAGILAATSNPNRTSPVKRGKFILDEILGDPVPPPPPGVGDLPDPDAAAAKPATLREQLDLHRGKPECAGCHRHLDPLGFGLEGFDAIGRVRLDASVDAAGALPGGQPFNGAAELKKLLLGVRRDDVVRCLAEKLLIYALGRGLEDGDATAIDTIVAATAHDDYKFSSLIVAVCQSHPFLYRRNAKDQP